MDKAMMYCDSEVGTKARALRALGFVSFKKRGRRNIVPETSVEEITLLIR